MVPHIMGRQKINIFSQFFFVIVTNSIISNIFSFRQKRNDHQENG